MREREREGERGSVLMLRSAFVFDGGGRDYFVKSIVYWLASRAHSISYFIRALSIKSTFHCRALAIKSTFH